MTAIYEALLVAAVAVLCAAVLRDVRGSDFWEGRQ